MLAQLKELTVTRIVDAWAADTRAYELHRNNVGSLFKLPEQKWFKIKKTTTWYT